MKAVSLFLSLLISLSLYAQNPTKKLVAIFAHPDDEQSVAPILVKAVEEGVEVTLVIVTDGRLGVNDYTDYVAGEGLAAIRRAEMKCAAEVLGVNLIHLNYHDQLKAAEGYDGHIPHVQNLILELKEILSSISPDIILTWGPDGATTHMDHRLVGASVTQVFVSQNWNHPIDLYYFGVPTDLLDSERTRTLRGQERKYLTTQIPFTQVQYDKAYEALECHKSQYPAEVVAQIKKEREKMGKTLYLRQFAAPQEIKTKIF